MPPSLPQPFTRKLKNVYLIQAGLLARPGCYLPIPQFVGTVVFDTSKFTIVKAFTATGIAPE